MNVKSLSILGAAGLITFGAFVHNAAATTQVVTFDRLTESAVVGPVLGAGDTLFLNTLVTQEVGALTQSITFSVGSSVSFEGFGTWEVTSATSTGPRLVGVDINVGGFSDVFVPPVVGFARSTLAGVLAPGTYTLLATGTGVRDSSLDVSVTFAAVPEPEIYGMLLAGLGLVAFVRLCRKQQAS